MFVLLQDRFPLFDVHHINWMYSLSGFIVGALVGLTGVGGGSLMTPLLVLLFGISPATAVGTDLLYAAITKSGGVLVHGFNKTIDWRIVGRLATGSVPATAVTIFILSRVGITGHAQHSLISTILGIALVLTAASIIFRKALLGRLAPTMEAMSDTRRHALTIVLGLFLGVFVSISSVGAGAIGVTVLLLLYPRAPLLRIVGADIAHAVPLTLIAGLGHWYHRIGQSDHFVFVADRVPARHRHRKPDRRACARPGSSPDHRDDPGHCRATLGVLRPSRDARRRTSAARPSIRFQKSRRRLRQAHGDR